MISVNPNPNNWTKQIYVAKFKSLDYDDEGNEIRVYDKPISYKFNYQPVTSYLDIQTFGKDASITKKMVISMSYKGVFDEYDVAYLDGASPKGELKNGNNANYIFLPPKEGNSAIIIYCQKIKGK